MSEQQRSPWADGDGLGEVRPTPQPAPTAQPAPTQPAAPSPWQPVHAEPAEQAHPEPAGWSAPQYFGAQAPQAPLQPAPPLQFGQRVVYSFGAAPEHPNAATSMVLGIVGLVTMFFWFPFVSPVAWYLAAKGRREMAREPGRWRDSGKLTAGFILGIVGSVLSAFAVLAMVAILLWLLSV